MKEQDWRRKIRMPSYRKYLESNDYENIVKAYRNPDPARTSDRDAELYCKTLRKTGKEKQATAFLEKVVDRGGCNYPRSVRLLARIYSVSGEYQKAIDLLQKTFDQRPMQYWYYLSMGDVYYYHKKDLEAAFQVYVKGMDIGKEHLRRDILSIYRYLLKRISHCLFELGRFKDVIWYFEEFKRLEPSNFYETDFVLLGQCYEKTGQKEKALEIWKEGTRRRKGRKCLKEIERVFPDEAKMIILKPPLPSKPGSVKIPVKTKIITEEDDAAQVIIESIKGIAQKGDIVTFASAVAAITQARIYSAETIQPTRIARMLSGFVTASSKNSFATTSPLANPLSFQVAIEIAGLLKILFATFCGALGKLIGKKGWFYMVAGPEVAMIDDMPASMAPYDYFVIPGPYNSDKLAQIIKEKTGFEAAIIDANDMGIAWAVGASDGVDKKELEQFMADNPAGNEDDQTPIIIIRKAAATGQKED